MTLPEDKDRKPVRVGDDVWIMYKTAPVLTRVLALEHGQFFICDGIGKRIRKEHAFHTRLEALVARYKVVSATIGTYSRRLLDVEAVVRSEPGGDNVDFDAVFAAYSQLMTNAGQSPGAEI